MADVEFLDSEPSWDDPKGFDTGKPEPPDRPPARRALRWVAALIVAATVIGWLATRPSGGPDVPAAAPPVITITATPAPVAIPTVIPRMLQRCLLRAGVSPTLVHLVRRYFPKAIVITGSTLLCPTLGRRSGSPVAAERLAVLVGRLAYRIEINRRGSQMPFDDSYWADAVVAGLHVQSAGLDVAIIATGPINTRVPYPRLRALAATLGLRPLP